MLVGASNVSSVYMFQPVQGVPDCKRRNSFVLDSWFLRKRPLDGGHFGHLFASARLLWHSLTRLLRLQMVSSDQVVVRPVLHISDVSVLRRPCFRILPTPIAPPSLVDH